MQFNAEFPRQVMNFPIISDEQIKQKKEALYEVQQDRFKVTLPLDECKIHVKSNNNNNNNNNNE